MLHYFNFALFFPALFHVALFHHFTIQLWNILILCYYFNIGLIHVTLDECCTFLFNSINIALLMSRVVLTLYILLTLTNLIYLNRINWLHVCNFWFRFFGFNIFDYLKIVLLEMPMHFRNPVGIKNWTNE